MHNTKVMYINYSFHKISFIIIYYCSTSPTDRPDFPIDAQCTLESRRRLGISKSVSQ